MAASAKALARGDANSTIGILRGAEELGLSGVTEASSCGSQGWVVGPIVRARSGHMPLVTAAARPYY